MAMRPQELVNPPEQESVSDVYLPYLPEKEELDRLDSLLTDMLARTQCELDRLTPPSPLTAPSPPAAAL
jgi:hypothetical protein